MSLYLGSTPVTGLYLGSTAITALYRGSTLVWSRDRIHENFDDADKWLKDTGRWVDQGTSTDYFAAIVDGVCRLGLPDGLLAALARTSRARFSAKVHGSDDGYIEARIATKGDGSPPLGGTTYTTQVFGRANNTGSTSTHGVGFALRQSQLFIVRRVAGTDTEVKACGSFGSGDVVRLKQAGNLHSLYRNGAFVGEWNDTGASAAKGAGYRSLSIRVDASKDLLGPRRFSPALDYVEYG